MASGRAEGPRAPPRRAAGFGVTNYPVFQPPPLTTCRGEAEHRRGFAPILVSRLGEATPHAAA